MKVLSYRPELCVGCHVCEEVCSHTWFKVTDVEKSRIRIQITEEGPLQAVHCVQCGDCIQVCPTEALYRDRRGIVRFRKNLCVGCLSCVGFCSYEAMFMHPDEEEPFNCIACGLCVKECPAEALAIIDVEEPAVTEER
jgi:Fe-S-cluster-containing dehydrogenase component